MCRRELKARDTAAFDETEEVGTRDLIKIMKEDEHPELVLKKEDELSDEENQALSYFCPTFL